MIPCGSDFPVESNNPMLDIYVAIIRQDSDGNLDSGWFSDQRIPVEESIRGFTIWAAYATFQEDVLGSIEVGKRFIIRESAYSVIPEKILRSSDDP